MSTPDLAPIIRAKLLTDAGLLALLPDYLGSKPIFTRRPAPTDAPFPMIIVSPDVAFTDQDGIRDFRPIILRDITVYGQNDTAQNYRDVETMARAIKDMFHSKREALVVPGWATMQSICTGPIPAPVDDDQTVARVVSVTIWLAALEQ